MNDDMIELCAEAKRRRDKALSDSGAAHHQGFYVGEILAEEIHDDVRVFRQVQILKLIAQVVRDYKAVPEVLAAIADGLET